MDLGRMSYPAEERHWRSWPMPLPKREEGTFFYEKEKHVFYRFLTQQRQPV